MPKFSALAALTGPNLAAADLFVIDDASATASKKITAADLLQGAIQAANKAILDESSNEWIKLVTTGSAVNEFTITNAATGTSPILSATGGDTNIGLALTPKGTGGLVLTGNGSALFAAGRLGATTPGLVLDASTATCVTGLKLVPAASGAGYALSIVGGGTNEAVTFDAKGSGTISLNATGTGNVIVGTNLQVGSAKSIVDAGGNEILKTAATVASAINELTLTNAAAGNPYLIAATGGDTDISVKLDAKGAGTLTFNATGTGNVLIGTNLQHASAKAIVDANGNESIKFPATVASAVNELTVSNAATTAAPTITATGNDTNISVDLVPKALGVIRARSALLDKVTQTAVTDTATITIAQLLTGCLDGTPTGAAVYTLPTAALLVAGIGNARVGDSFVFVVNNKDGTNGITVAAGSGGTADGTLTVAHDTIRLFKVIITNVTGSSEAYFVYGLGA